MHYSDSFLMNRDYKLNHSSYERNKDARDWKQMNTYERNMLERDQHREHPQLKGAPQIIQKYLDAQHTETENNCIQSSHKEKLYSLADRQANTIFKYFDNLFPMLKIFSLKYTCDASEVVGELNESERNYLISSLDEDFIQTTKRSSYIKTIHDNFMTLYPLLSILAKKYTCDPSEVIGELNLSERKSLLLLS